MKFTLIYQCLLYQFRANQRTVFYYWLYFLYLQKLLVNDPSDPQKYATIRVSRAGYRIMISRASKSKESCKKLLNEALDLIFTKDELANSSGMGLRKDKKRPNNRPLDPLKIAAIIGKCYLLKPQWTRGPV